MCDSCWERGGSPTIVNEKTRAAVRCMGPVYHYNGAGGGLHVILDDWNVDDATIKWVRGYIAEPDYMREAGPKRLRAEQRCLAVFASLSVDERLSALAVHGHIIPGG